MTTIIHLKQVISSVPRVLDAISGGGQARGSILTAIANDLAEPQISVLTAMLSDMIEEDTVYAKTSSVMQLNMCFAIKANKNRPLDILRETYRDTMSRIQSFADEYKEHFDFPKLTVTHTTRRGWHLTMPHLPGGPDLPPVFTKVVRTNKKLAFSTTELDGLNLELEDTVLQIYEITDRLLEDTFKALREHLSYLYTLSEAIALLDMMLSLSTHVTLASAYTRPEILEEGRIMIKEGRHPIIEALHSNSFVANDVYCSSTVNFHIITGPNMAGKSTYLQQIALITVLAHIGCYVPATFCAMTCVERLFTRIGSNDDLESNAGTFMVEMQETSYILRNLAKSSLVIIDELGRGTSHNEGLAIAWSVCEYLLHCPAMTFFATHYLELEALDGMYPNVTLHNMMVTIAPTKDHLNYLYTINDGIASRKNYMTAFVARVAGMPPAIVDTANDMAKILESKLNGISKAPTTEQQQSKLCYQVAERLMPYRYSTLRGDDLRATLWDLQKKFQSNDSEISMASDNQTKDMQVD